MTAQSLALRGMALCLLNLQLLHAAQISGHVLDAGDSQPIVGAILDFQQGFPPPGFVATTTTDSSGYYQEEVPAGDVTVTVNATGYAMYAQTLTVGSAPLPVDFALTRAGSISGTVRAAASSLTLSGERVVLLSANNLDQGSETVTSPTAASRSAGCFLIDIPYASSIRSMCIATFAMTLI